MHARLASIALFSLLGACGGSATHTETAASAAPTFADQVERGGTLYGEHCAS